MRRSFGVDKKLYTSFPFKRIGSADQISENRISYACVELAQSWIAECENSHKGCIINKDSVLPTRVVKVGSFQLIHASMSANQGNVLAMLLSVIVGEVYPL